MNSYKINNRPYYKRENVIRFSIDIIIRVTVTTRREIAYIQKQTMIKSKHSAQGRRRTNDDEWTYGGVLYMCVCVCVDMKQQVCAA